MNNHQNPGAIHRFCLPAIVALAIAGMAACSGQGDVTATGDASAEAAQASETEARNDDDSAEPTPPDWYLAEFPQHPDLRLKSMTSPASGAYLMTYTAGGGDGQELTDWFKSHYNQGGWAIDMEQGDSRFTAEKGGAYSAVVGINATKYATIVSITAHGGQ